ncbi:extensin-like isoform X1 [Sinocyclocheilus anshuiensis]|uniref:extensin-like isoform X1 n=2 Tax=Sinocyclocheilus anshuiensis TaxID=1608454 RepID=UPI0007B7D5F1|nr:PREDICTED: extensin-like isoform X1 [Sinocyclocheilus anshuiensis]
MKKGSFNFLGRKNQSLFDTNVEIRDMDNVELVLDSAAIPESGTAKVRSRPTVKHFMSSESAQGFAVPTPKVPVLPPFNEPKINGTGSTTNLSNGRMLSVPDLLEGEILIPPPPSSAPPPPPSYSAPPPPSFIPPPPQFFGEMDPSLDRASLHPPPMAPPKPPSLTSSNYSADLDLASLKPPPMPPPKPPSETSSLRGSLSSLDVQDFPECPKFNPPPPPVLAKAQKAAPPKPIRMSSIPNLDIQSQTPVPPVASNPTPSSFNPQNTAKLYSVQKSTLLGGQTDREKKVQSILLLEDSAGNTVGVVNGNSGKNAESFQPGVLPTKPARRNSSATHLQDDQPDMAQAPREQAKVEPKINPEPVTPQNIPTEIPAPIKVSPKIEKRIPDVRQVVTPVASPGRPRKYSPILNHRHLNTRGADGSVKKETSTSPFALLMAAKEREKQRTALSQQNSNSRDPVNSVIQPSVEKPNSFTVTPRDPTPDSPNAQLKLTTNTQPLASLSTKVDGPHVSYSKPELSSTPLRSPMNSSVSGLGVPVRDVEIGEDLVFIPPPPEFANSDSEEEPPVPPPSHPAPAPPVKSAPPPAKTLLPATPAPITNSPPPSHPAPATPVKPAPLPSKPLPIPITNGSLPSHPAPAPTPAKPSLPPTPPPSTNGPLISPKPKPPSCPPKAPGPPPNIQPQSKPPVQTKPTQPIAQVPPSVSASQATLLSILQKKMLEMDPKFSAVKEVETNGDDWNYPLSDDEATSPLTTYNPMTNRSATLPAQTRGVDMKELESKAAKKAQNLATSTKSQNSNGSSTKQQFGMTFTVRPGAKQPITPVIKDGSS